MYVTVLRKCDVCGSKRERLFLFFFFISVEADRMCHKLVFLTVWMRTGAVDEVILHINHAAEIQSATLHLRLIQIHAAVHHVYSFSALKLTLQLHVWVRWKTLQHNLLSRSLNYVSISKYQWIVKKKWKRLIFKEKLRCWEIHVLFFG